MTRPAGAFVVRPVERSEVDALHALWRAADDRGDWRPASGGQGLIEELDILASEGRVWAAFQRGSPVAFAAAGDLDGALWLSVFGVSRACRGRRLASSLLAAVLGYGQWAQYPALVALAPKGESAFLERVGFLRLDGDRLADGLRELARSRGLAAWARPI